jgi:hypothetical protein
MTFSSKREWRRARRAYARSRMRSKHSHPPHAHIAPNETRDELIIEARRILERIGWKKNHPAHPLSRSEVRHELATAGLLRAAAASRPRVDPAGLAFYVSIRDGARSACLYGPFPTQLTALRALPIAKACALRVSPEAAFAAFGTASMPHEHAEAGRLNHLLPPILELA